MLGLIYEPRTPKYCDPKRKKLIFFSCVFAFHLFVRMQKNENKIREQSMNERDAKKSEK